MDTTMQTSQPVAGKIWKHVSPPLVATNGCKLMQDWASSRFEFLYHHSEWPYAKLVLANHRLRLSATSSWTDPYEKAWINILFNRPSSALNGAVAYGMCFTTSKFDEPSWRMHGFGRQQPMVRLKLRTACIIDAARASLSMQPGSWFLGSVRYRRTSDLNSLAQTVIGDKQKDVSRMAAEMLVHKRNAFKFENEVRLLFIAPRDMPARDDILLSIDSTAIVQVMSSPHTSSVDCHRVEKELHELGRKLKRSGVLEGPKWALSDEGS